MWHRKSDIDDEEQTNLAFRSLPSSNRGCQLLNKIQSHRHTLSLLAGTNVSNNLCLSSSGRCISFCREGNNCLFCITWTPGVCNTLSNPWANRGRVDLGESENADVILTNGTKVRLTMRIQVLTWYNVHRWS